MSDPKDWAKKKFGPKWKALAAVIAGGSVLAAVMLVVRWVGGA